MPDKKKLPVRKKGKASALDELAIIGAFKAFDKNNDGLGNFSSLFIFFNNNVLLSL